MAIRINPTAGENARQLLRDYSNYLTAKLAIDMADDTCDPEVQARVIGHAPKIVLVSLVKMMNRLPANVEDFKEWARALTCDLLLDLATVTSHPRLLAGIVRKWPHLIFTTLSDLDYEIGEFVDSGELAIIPTDELEEIFSMILTGLLLIALALWGFGHKKPFDPLDRTLFTWAATPFKLRDLTRSVLIFGAPGSGKTSGSGAFFLNVLLAIRNSGGLIIASKPEERAAVIRACTKAGRLSDLRILGPDEELRWNFLHALGGDPNNIVNGIDVVAEMMSKETGHSKEPFWPRKRKELFYHAVVILKLAGQEITAFNIMRFINAAATDPSMLMDPGWQKNCHSLVLEAAMKAKPKMSARELFDYEAANEYWTRTWPQMADKTRSNIEAEATGVLAPMLSGVVRDLIGTTTNFSFGDLTCGKILLLDMALPIFGESGRMVGATIKYIVQRGIMARHVQGDDGPVFILTDECHNYTSSYDPIVLNEQRSHGGVSIYLTQSIHSFYAALGEHPTESLLGAFGTKISHLLGDAKSAAYASGLLAEQLDVLTGGSPKPAESPFDAPEFVANYNQNYLPVLQPSAFLSGMRTSGGVVDAVVIRSDPFASGDRHALISFKQE